MAVPGNRKTSLERLQPILFCLLNMLKEKLALAAMLY